MNGSFRSSLFVLGSAALLSIAGGCARESKPAQTAGPSETFESRTSEGSMGEMGSSDQASGTAHQHGMGHMHTGMGATPDQQDAQVQHGQGQQGQQGQGLQGQQGQGLQGQGAAQSGAGQTAAQPGQGFGQTTANAQAHAAADMMSEQELCSQLVQGSAIRVENIERGVRVVLSPKNRGDLAAVRESVQRIEARLQPTAQSTPRGDEASRCALFDVVALGARATISEGPSQVTLLIVATDEKPVAEVRSRVRAFAAGPGAAQTGAGNGQKQQGTTGGQTGQGTRGGQNGQGTTGGQNGQGTPQGKPQGSERGNTPVPDGDRRNLP